MNRYRCARELLNGTGLTDPQLEKAVLNPGTRFLAHIHFVKT